MRKICFMMVSLLLIICVAGCTAPQKTADKTTVKQTTTVPTTLPTQPTTEQTTTEPSATDASTTKQTTAKPQKTTASLKPSKIPTTQPLQYFTVDLMKSVKAYKVLPKQTDNAFIESQMRFSVDLFKASAAKSKNENMLISPLSVQLALSMTANGADGKTRAEMEKVLGGGMSIEDLNKQLKFYVDSLPSNEAAKLNFANSIWFRDTDDLTIENDFLRTNATYYNAGAFRSPFNEDTVGDINNWVSDNTDGLIDNIVDDISPNDMMCLINTIMFDAEWEHSNVDISQFKGTFTSATGQTRTADMMGTKEYTYLSDENSTGFIRDYASKRYSFAAILPDENVGINDYIAGLTWEKLLGILQNAQDTYVKATFPKFKYECDINMNDTLSSLGMPTAFRENANFSKITKSGGLYVSEVRHKTFIEVNEIGTTAAAASMARVTKGIMNSYETVVLDRPFVYMIIDNNTKTPIFIGALMDIGG